MTYPTVAVTTTNMDAGTDSPATARSDILDAMQKLNQMIAHVSTFAATVLDDTTAAAARATLEVITRMPYVAGRYYTAPFNSRASQGGTMAVVANTMYLIPYRQEITGSMAALAVSVSTGVAGNVRLGLYADSAGVPGTLIATAGTISTSTSGVKDVVYTTSIPAGNYWLAAQFDAAPSLHKYDGADHAVLGMTSVVVAGFSSDTHIGYSASATYASGLPSTPASPTLIYAAPTIAVKA